MGTEEHLLLEVYQRVAEKRDIVASLSTKSVDRKKVIKLLKNTGYCIKNLWGTKKVLSPGITVNSYLCRGTSVGGRLFSYPSWRYLKL